MIACSIMVEGYTFVGETRRVGGEFFPAAHDFHTCRAVSVTLDRDPRRSPASPVRTTLYLRLLSSHRTKQLSRLLRSHKL